MRNSNFMQGNECFETLIEVAFESVPTTLKGLNMKSPVSCLLTGL